MKISQQGNWSYSSMPVEPTDLGTLQFKFAGTCHSLHIYILWRILLKNSILWKFSCWDDLPNLFCIVGIHWFGKLDRYLHILYSRILEATFQISLAYSILINFTARQEPSLKNMGRSPFKEKTISNVCSISCYSSATEWLIKVVHNLSKNCIIVIYNL